MVDMYDCQGNKYEIISRVAHQNSASWLSELVGIEVVRPSATVGEPVEGDGVGVAVAVVVLHRRRLGEDHHLSGLDALIGALARVGSRKSNAHTGALGVIANEAKCLNRERGDGL